MIKTSKPNNSNKNRPTYSTVKKRTAYTEEEQIPPRKTSATRISRARRRRNAFIKLILFVAVIIAGIAVGVNIVRKTITPSCYEITSSSITMYYTSPSVIIKNETGYSYPAGSTVVSRLPDGTTVKAGDEIAILRTEGFNDDWYAQLEIARRNTIEYILRNISNDKGTLANAIRVIDERINTLTEEMINVVAYNPSEYNEYSKQIKELYEQKTVQALAVFGSDAQLSDFLDKEKIIEEKINSCTQHVVALKSGILSYNTDGLANVYNYDTIDKLTRTNLQSIISNTTSSTVNRTRMASDYYISDMSKCYVATFGSGSDFSYLSKNDEVIIRINKNPNFATITKVIHSDDGAFLIFEPVGEFPELYRSRVLDVTIQKTWNGLVVPKEHIVKNKDQVGVYVYDEAEKTQTFVPITIAAENDTVVILDTSSIDNIFTKGVKIVKQK